MEGMYIYIHVLVIKECLLRRNPTHETLSRRDVESDLASSGRNSRKVILLLNLLSKVTTELNIDKFYHRTSSNSNLGTQCAPFERFYT